MVTNSVNIENWSNTSTWGGSIPDKNTEVVIPEGKTVVLDVPSVDIKNLTIEGNLIFDNIDIDLTVDSISIKGGELQIGTEQNPYNKKALITLTDQRSLSQGDAMGVKYIGVSDEGSLELHGSSRSKTSWTQLATTAKAGSTSIQLINNNLGWKPGDEIVIASSNLDPREAEKVTVTEVEGNTVSFDRPLQYDHYGKQHSYSGKTIDMRAEVGLLSRNIVIQGDESSSKDRIGGHLMIMNSANARLEGVELRNMGQMGEKGRYPIHWHRVGNGSTQYAKNNSIHNSFNRGIVTHDTDNVKVLKNVVYDVFSHGYVPAEEGTETGNIYNYNLGILNKGLTEEQFAFGESRSGGDFESTQEEHRPGMFWMTNLNNTMIDNHAAGSWNGNGFLFSKPSYRNWIDMARQAQDNPGGEIGTFKDNLAHSTFRYRIGNLGFYGTSSSGWGLFFRELPRGKFPDVKQTIDGFSAYKTQLGGAWIEGNSILENSIITDSDTGVFLADNAVVEDGVIVGQTPNTTGSVKTIRVKPKRKTPEFENIEIDFSQPLYSHGGIFNIPHMNKIEEGAAIKDVQFHNLPVGIYLNDLNKLDDGTFSVEGIDLIDTPFPLVFDTEVTNGGVLDKDGSISGIPGNIIQDTNEYKLTGSIEPLSGDKGFVWDNF